MMRNTNKTFGSFTRLVSGFLLGSGMVAILFWAMQAMIKMTEFEEVDVTKVKLLEFVEVKPDNTPLTKRDRIVEPPRPTDPPKQPPPPTFDNPKVDGPILTVTAAPVKTQVSFNHSGFTVAAIGEGKYLPIVKIPPIYPIKAQEKGIEGHCTVIYTVTKQGSTANHRIDDNDCSSRLFHEASIKAAKGFKYKPTVRNGVAIDVAGIKNRFRYKF